MEENQLRSSRKCLRYQRGNQKRKSKRDRQYKGQTMTYKTLHKKLY
jgi:hypothetical protein